MTSENLHLGQNGMNIIAWIIPSFFAFVNDHFFKSSWANLWGMFRKKKFWKNSSVGDRLTIGRQIKRDDVISSDFEWWLPYKETSAEFSQAKSSKNMACLITFLTLDPFIVYISIFISKWHKSSSDFQTPWGVFS